ncbi:transcription factor FapR [Natranaerobius trueperi]|uniref:Fatty acid biosynthesis transcriptional regulator n=1 Tax=Natranaerobius trueperi TaxID=759412 RepID=A0A226C1A0_9FIRM|nr:transcription factor FapR [Natranaerobius trueperi]OWZ84187.1 fatty acid biosynthesis transcriptional regulator [Natranaerobius trueperi]
MVDNASNRKLARQRQLKKLVELNPFLTDKDLSEMLQVSVPTIRLDRSELNIPEYRDRISKMARTSYKKIQSLETEDIVGQLVDLKLGEEAVSYLETTNEMTFTKTNIIRGIHLFAQANALAAAIMDAPLALTGSASVRYLRPVKMGERLICRGFVKRSREKQLYIDVNTWVDEEKVFEGTFLIFASKEDDHDC